MILVTQNLLESQRRTIREQLLDVGIKVTLFKPRGKSIWLGYVDNISFTTIPIKVTVRYNNGVTELTESQNKGFNFILTKGRFILTQGKSK